MDRSSGRARSVLRLVAFGDVVVDDQVEVIDERDCRGRGRRVIDLRASAYVSVMQQRSRIATRGQTQTRVIVGGYLTLDPRTHSLYSCDSPVADRIGSACAGDCPGADPAINRSNVVWLANLSTRDSCRRPKPCDPSFHTGHSQRRDDP